MTAAHGKAGDMASEPRPSLLPFDPADLVAMRVLPAEFARMLGVSRQSVSRWIKEGKVTLGPDGKLDPAKASREVIQRSDPARLRARVLKQATASHDELSRRVARLEAALRDRDERERALVQATEGQAAEALGRFMDALVDRFAEASRAAEAGGLAEWLDELAAVEFHGLELAEYRESLADDETGGCPVAPGESSM